MRTLNEIATEIGQDWPKVLEAGTPGPFGNIGQHPANPYWRAMNSLISVNDNYGQDDAKSIVLYFLSNSAGWRGETAKRIKAELRSMVK